MAPNDQAMIEAVPADSASDLAHNTLRSGWIQPSLTKIDLGGSPVGTVDDLYVRYEPEGEIGVWTDEDWNTALNAMFADPQIQREIEAIEEEFTSTLQDGLEDEL